MSIIAEWVDAAYKKGYRTVKGEKYTDFIKRVLESEAEKAEPSIVTIEK